MSFDLNQEAKQLYDKLGKELGALMNAGFPMNEAVSALMLKKMDTIISLLQQLVDQQSLTPQLANTTQPSIYHVKLLELPRKAKDEISDAIYTLLRNGENCSYADLLDEGTISALIDNGVIFTGCLDSAMCSAKVPANTREVFNNILTQLNILISS